MAGLAIGRVSPDPYVGAVVVKNNKIIAKGYHGEVATPHAESWALKKAGEKARGATLYVNLEPCCHYGNNPPCADLILSCGIKEVVVAMQDPNPLVNGKGIKKLRKHGVKVRVGLLEKQAKLLNEVFIKNITTSLPFVVLKEAQTLDGKIATRTGNSRWVSSVDTQKFAHSLRNVYDAILCGVNTVLLDDPKLTTRLAIKIKNPIRIILDSKARTPLNSNVLNVKEARTIIVVGPKAPKKKVKAIEAKGAEVLKINALNGKINVQMLLKKLGKMKITSVLVEGGGEVAASFLEKGLVDKAHFIFAPKIFGGRDAKTGVEGTGVKLPSQALMLKDLEVSRLGPDILISGYF